MPAARRRRSPLLPCLWTVVAAISATMLPVMAADSNWNQFRGPGARGIASGRIPERWSATENVEWKAELPGMGWSSPVVWGNRVFLTTVVSERQPEPPKKGLYFGGDRPTPPGDTHQWKALCLDLRSGRKLWETSLHSGAPASSRHLKNSFASETPVTDGERLYVLFGNLGLYALDLNGKLLWKRPIAPRKTRLGWGTAASPTLHEGRLYVVNDNEEESYLEALEARSGRQIWRVARDEKSNWATPYVWRNSRRTELVTPGSGLVRSYDLNGRLLWSLEGMSSITIGTPYAEGDTLFVSSGYVGSPLRPLYAIKAGGEGNISIGRDQTSGPFVTWCDWRGAPYNPTTLLANGRLFVLFDFGFLAAYHAGTGRMLFDKVRIPEGLRFTASPWAAGDKIYCLNEDGKTFVFKNSDRYDLTHTNSLAEDDMCMATPALAGDRLLIRTAARLYSIRERRP